jgi:hypothetical protein
VSQLARSLARTHAQQWAAVQRKRALERHSRRSRFSSIKGSAAPAPSPAGARLADVHARNLTPTTTTVHRLTTPAHLFALVQCPSRAPRPPHPHVYPGPGPAKTNRVRRTGRRESNHGRREAGVRPVPSRPAPRPGAPPGLAPRRARGPAAAGPGARASSCLGGAPARRARARARARGAGGRRQRGRGSGARGAEAVGAADVPRGGRHVQPRDHVHGRRRRLLPLRLANGGTVRYVVARNEARRVASRRSVCVHSRSWVDSVRWCLARAAARSR